MLTINEVIAELQKLDGALNTIEVKGKANVDALCFSINETENLISGLNECIEEIAKQQKNQNGGTAEHNEEPPIEEGD